MTLILGVRLEDELILNETNSVNVDRHCRVQFSVRLVHELNGKFAVGVGSVEDRSESGGTQLRRPRMFWSGDKASWRSGTKPARPFRPRGVPMPNTFRRITNRFRTAT